MRDGSSLSFLILIVGIVFAIFIMAQVALYRVATSWNVHRRDKVTDATMVTKRSQYQGGSENLFYATFEMKDKSRKEYQVTEKQYGLLAIGDKGKLTHDKDRFVAFKVG